MKKRVNLRYRDAVGLMILNENFDVFIGKRIDTKHNSWQMPQGGIDDGETLEQAALREMEEEIGNRNGEILAITKQWYSYDIPVHLISKLWQGQYRGQRQKWLLIKYKGTDADINISKNEHPEFSEWKWSSLEEVVHNVVLFKREIYLSVIEELRDDILKLKGF